MSEPWTPGPWVVDGRTIRAAGSRPVAQGIVLDKNRKANAQLIALAPEMVEQLDVLKSALSVALHYTEAEYDHAGEEALIGCRLALTETRALLARARAE